MDVRGLRRAARFLLDNLDDLTDEDFDGAAQEQSDELVAAADHREHDQSRLRIVGERLKNSGLVSGAASGTSRGSIRWPAECGAG